MNLYLICDKCKRISIKRLSNDLSGLQHDLTEGHTLCDDWRCDGHLCIIDEMITPTVDALNKKGYVTVYSCSSHIDEKSIDPYVTLSIQSHGGFRESIEFCQYLKDKFRKYADMACDAWHGVIESEGLNVGFVITSKLVSFDEDTDYYNYQITVRYNICKPPFASQMIQICGKLWDLKYDADRLVLRSIANAMLLNWANEISPYTVLMDAYINEISNEEIDTEEQSEGEVIN